MPDTTVQYHTDGYGRPARPAVNVKVHGTDFAAYDRLCAAISNVDDLYQRAEEVIFARFWSDAADMAASLGLGPITQEGRSGGWLVLTDGRSPELYTPSTTDKEDVRAYAAARRDWLAAYRKLADWCAERVHTAPARVAALAQQLAMDELGAEPAHRMWLAAGEAVPA